MTAAILVLYFPSIENVDNIISVLKNQTQKILLIDNTPIQQRKHTWQNTDAVEYIALDDNEGIAYAQNIGIKYAISLNFKYVILFDQDSIPPAEMIPNLITAEQKLTASGKPVGVIGPTYRDTIKDTYSQAFETSKWNVKRALVNPKCEDPVESDLLVASGSLIKIEVLQKVGLMLEELFIDGVDTEWCFRARGKGYLTYIYPKVLMTHSLGDRFITIAGKKITLHSQIRHYYYIRNSIYFMRKPYFPRGWKINMSIKIPLYIVIYCLSSTEKFMAFKILLKASLDGVIANLGPYKHR